MSLSRKIASLREKPEAVRTRILIVSMAVITGIVLTGWFFVFRLERGSSNQDTGAVTGFFKSVGSSFSSTFGQLKSK